MLKVKSESVSTDVLSGGSTPKGATCYCCQRFSQACREITIPIGLINPSLDSVTLYKGSTVASVSGIDLSNVVANINPKPPDTHPDVSKAERELLWGPSLWKWSGF